MIIVEQNNGDVAFFNEREHIDFTFEKETKIFTAFPVTKDYLKREVTDVKSVTFISDTHPAMQKFLTETKGGIEDDIMTVYEEIDRLDIEEKNLQKQEHPNWRNIQKRGSATRFANVCRGNDISTVGQLLSLGRAKFEKLHNMGRECAEIVEQALKNLYDIETW